jgi:microcystin-dependent protein
MKDHRKTAIAAAATLMLTLSAIAQSVPNLINYQGRLTDQTGAPLVPGFYGIQFKLWDSPSPSTANLVWAQQQTVAIQSNGVFNVILGSPGGTSVAGVTPAVNDLTYAFTANNRFLGLKVVSNPSGAVPNPSEILPRQQLLSVPFAVQAQQAQVASSLVTNLANALSPAGTVVAYMGTTAPPGWLLCDGSAVSRTEYSALLTVIGTASGGGDGSTTFNLPDFRGQFLRGLDNGRGVDPGRQLAAAQTDAVGAHNHSIHSASSGYASGGGGQYGVQLVYRADGTPNSSTYNTDNSSGAETRPKNIAVNYTIKY